MAMEGMLWKKNSNRDVFEKDRVVRLFHSRDGSEDGPGRPVMFWNRLCLQRYPHHLVMFALADTPANVKFS